MERNGENLQINFHGNKLTLALDEIKYFVRCHPNYLGSVRRSWQSIRRIFC